VSSGSREKSERVSKLTVLVHRTNEFISVGGTRYVDVVLTKPSLDSSITPREVVVRFSSDLGVVLVELTHDLSTDQPINLYSRCVIRRKE